MNTNTYIGIGVAAFVIVLIVIISVVICVAYRRKLAESHKARKRMQNQMDMLEAKVAKECREGKYLVLLISVHW